MTAGRCALPARKAVLLALWAMCCVLLWCAVFCHIKLCYAVLCCAVSVSFTTMQNGIAQLLTLPRLHCSAHVPLAKAYH